MKKNIILIGYRCTGKSTVGKKLAHVMGLHFVDTDEVVQERAGRSIHEIVERGGWELFRIREREVVEDFARAMGIVIATGGGVPLDRGNRQVLERNGLIIWLRADMETIEERMNCDEKTGEQRPGLTSCDVREEIGRLLPERERIYRPMADLVADTSMKGIDEIVDDILNYIRENRETICQEIR